jgi:H+-translocating NAD(P) transhydrogenase subunit alpha
VNLPLLELYVFVLAGFVGYLVITRVPPLLHTPLMSATNAISAISLVGSLVAAGNDKGTVSTVLGFIAVTAATINVVGGFVITDRMLKMFKKREAPKGGASASASASALGAGPSSRVPNAQAPSSQPSAERRAPTSS